MSVERYRKISKIQIWNYNTPRIRAHYPKPTQNDYEVGYIRRYFIQKINDINASIYEISSVESKRLSQHKNYTIVSIKWRISGPIERTFKNSVVDRGVRESNRIAISLVNDTMPNLKNYLPNLLQFHK